MILRIVVGEIIEEKAVREQIKLKQKDKTVLQFLTPDELLHSNLNNIFDMIDNTDFSDVHFSCSHRVRGVNLEKYKFFVEQIRIYYTNQKHFQRTYPKRMANFRANIRKIRPMNKPRKAVIIGAGPSFNEENANIIMKNRDIMRIVVGHAAERAHRFGLKPDYVVEIDQDAAQNWITHDATFDCPLVAPPTMDPLIVERFKEVIWCSPGDSFDKHLRKILPNYLRVMHNKGVIVSAINVAWLMGCNECITVGNDLSYTEMPDVPDDIRHEVKGVHREAVWTTLDYMMIVKAIENYLTDYWPDKISVCSIPFGAFIRGMQYRKLTEFMMTGDFDFQSYAAEKGLYLSSVSAAEKQELGVL